MGEKKTGLVFFPAPGVGHLISTVELAIRLLETNPSFSITVFLMHFHLPSAKYATNTASYVQSVASTHPAIVFVHLPHLHHQFQPDHDKVSSFCDFVEKHRPYLKEAIMELLSSSPLTSISALFLDLFAPTMIDVGKELGIPTYIYFPSGANLLGLMLYLPTLDLRITGEFRDYAGEIEIPGLMPFPPAAVPDPMTEKKSSGYARFVSYGRRFRESDGIVVNTFQELEPRALQAINEGKCLPDHPSTPPVYTVGPLLASNKNSREEEETGKVIEWLDQQPPSSVVFLCFGSMGSFSARQLKEMAKGLEQSGHRFLWALRCNDADEMEKILPDGFLGRINDRGLVWQFWVPQTAVLEHEAVGGFISHCGWNSILESIWFGKPILAWPLYAEQKMNAFQLVHDFGIALELDRKEDGWVSAEELEKGVGSLMGKSEQGQKVKQRMKEMSYASNRAMERGGSSFSSLQLLLEKLVK